MAVLSIGSMARILCSQFARWGWRTTPSAEVVAIRHLVVVEAVLVKQGLRSRPYTDDPAWRCGGRGRRGVVNID